MVPFNSARKVPYAVVTLLSVGLLAGAAGPVGAYAAASKPVADHSASVPGTPIVGRLQTAKKNALTLLAPGRKTTTRIQLTSRTQYIVRGKHVARAPTFTRGLLLTVTATQSKGSFTAQLVIVDPTVPPASAAATAAPPPVPSTGLIALDGIVTLASALSVTLETSKGTRTIKLTGATRYVVKGKASAVKPTLHAGEKARVVAVQSRGVLVGQSFAVK